MHPGLKIFFTLATVLGYVIASIYWEIYVIETVSWWWTELFSIRYKQTMLAALFHFLAVIVLTLAVVPYFLWVPVWIAKEILQLVKEYLRRQPYESRHA